MDAIKLSVFNIEGKEVGDVTLDAHIFDGTVNEAVLYQVVNAYRANQRTGLASTKTRGEVSGGGKKPWKQKGTGRARHGSSRSPLWRHGGVTFGPHPRDFSYNLSPKIRNLALKSALNDKVNSNNLVVLDTFAVDSAKTKDSIKAFSNLKLIVGKGKQPKLLLLLDAVRQNQKLALRNISRLVFNLATEAHAYDVLSSDKLIITKDSLAQLVKRLKK
jgi:large subunit ribosomal protein L4